MLAKTQDNEEIIERVAALDIGKAELVCCVRVPDEDRAGRRLQEVETYSTMTRPLLGMADRLACLGVTRVVMEATSDYWKPVFYLLEAAGFETWLVNAKDVRHLPGRPKTDKLDAVWLCKVAERQMIRPSFVPPPPIRRLRDLTRLPRRSGGGPDCGEEPGGEAAGGRADQAERRGLRHLRGFGAGHAGRAGGRGA
jgi:transposase